VNSPKIWPLERLSEANAALARQKSGGGVGIERRQLFFVLIFDSFHQGKE